MVFVSACFHNLSFLSFKMIAWAWQQQMCTQVHLIVRVWVCFDGVPSHWCGLPEPEAPDSLCQYTHTNLAC